MNAEMKQFETKVPPRVLALIKRHEVGSRLWERTEATVGLLQRFAFKNVRLYKRKSPW